MQEKLENKDPSPMKNRTHLSLICSRPFQMKVPDQGSIELAKKARFLKKRTQMARDRKRKWAFLASSIDVH